MSPKTIADLASVGNLLTLSFGASGSWATVNFLILQTDETPVKTGKISLAEASLVMSMLLVGAVFGNVTFGYVAKRFGRKKPLLFVAVPQFMSWLLCLWPENVWYLYLARLLSGFVAGTLYVLIPLYVTEIADDSIRGKLGSIMTFSLTFGMLLELIIGNYFSYHMQPVLFLILNIVFVCVFIKFPESPQYLRHIKMHDQAREATKYFHGDTEQQKTEAFLSDVETNLKKSTCSLNVESYQRASLKWCDFTTRPALKALFIGVSMGFINTFSGYYTILKYSTFIFTYAKTVLTPGESAIIIGFVQIIGTYLAIHFVDKLGRKFLLILSTGATGIGITLLGIYYYLDLDAYTWFPLMMISVVILIASIGIAPVPIIIITEIFPEQIREYCCSFCSTLMWIFDFVLTIIYPILSESLGIYSSMWCLAACNFIGLILVKFFVPETSGKSAKEILKLLEK